MGKQIEFYTSMTNSSLCGYSDVYRLVKRTITITGTRANSVAQREDRKNK